MNTSTQKKDVKKTENDPLRTLSLSKDLGKIFVETLLTCGVVGILIIPFIGLSTLSQRLDQPLIYSFDTIKLVFSNIILQQNWHHVLLFMAIVFAAKLSVALIQKPQYRQLGIFVTAAFGLAVFYNHEWFGVEVLYHATYLVLWGVALRGLWLYAMPYFETTSKENENQPFIIHYTQALKSFITRHHLWVIAFVFLLLTLYPFTPWANESTVDVCILIMIYIILGWGLNIVVGLAGLLDLGFIAFYAVGAYSYALLTYDPFVIDLGFISWTVGFWTCLPIAACCTILAGLALGYPVLRLRGDYFAIVTLGFGEIIRLVLLNWVDLTNGSDGLVAPSINAFGYSFERKSYDGEPSLFVELQNYFPNLDIVYDPYYAVAFLYLVTLGILLIAHAFTMRLRRLPIGRAWEALRENDIACRSLGINLRNIKLNAFVFGAMLAGVAGVLFAAKTGYVFPESFVFIESAIVLAVVVLGGMGSQLGVVLASVFLIGLPEVFRELHDYRMLAFGASMALIMLWKPNGLISSRTVSILYKSPKAGGR